MSNMPKKIVAKFGGTSMADAKSMRRVGEIITDTNPALVVVSATSGTTNLLENLSRQAPTQSIELSEEAISELRDKHNKIANNLGVSNEVKQQLTELIDEAETLVKGMQMLKEAPKATCDRLMSIGERLSSLLLAAYLKQQNKSKYGLLDARLIITTNEDHGHAQPDYKQIAKNAEEHLLLLFKKTQTLVTQGFIGRSAQGNTTTLGRGGSDFSAAIMAEAIHADELHIWTDVSGIASTDPRIVPHAHALQELTYGEAAELAAAGAKILYPPTVIPTKRSKIPIRVLSTFEPDQPGTLIRDEIDEKPLIRAIAVKPNQHMITLTSPLFNEEYGFMSRVFDIFAKYKINIDLITTSETAVALTIDDELINHKQLFKDLESFVDVELEKNMSVVSIVGNRMNKTPGVATHIFGALGDSSEAINVRMICQGAYKHAMALVIDNKNSHAAVKALHKRLLEEDFYS